MHDLDREISGLIREIRRLASADDLSDTQKVAAIRGALEDERTGALDRLKAGLDDAAPNRSWHEPRRRATVRRGSLRTMEHADFHCRSDE